MKLSEKVSFIIILTSFLLKVITVPASPGDFYGPSHYYNLYLPDFGLGSEVSILPNSFKTLSAEYSFQKILLELFQGDVLILHRLLYILSPILIFFSFILFFGTISELRKNRVITSSLLTIICNWNNVALILGMSVLFSIVQNIYSKNSSLKIILILSFTSLALYWHSAHMLFFIICVFILIFIIFFNKKTYIFQKNFKETLNQFLMVFIISIITWIWIRETPLFSEIFKITYYFDPSVIVKALFSKGSFLPVEYQYIFNFYIPTSYLDFMRYTVYFLIFSVFSQYIIRNIYEKNYNNKLFLALSYMFGSIVFMLLYYIATETIGPAPILLILMPFLLMLCVHYIKIGSKRSKLGWMLLFFVLISSQIIMVSYSTYISASYSVEYSIGFERYYSPSLWITEHLPIATRLFSDANTLGYVAIWYGKNIWYENNLIFFSSIGLSIYDQLCKGIYNDNSIIIYNFELYKKNLVFESLTAWDKFKPLHPNIIEKNYLNVLYNDDVILVLTK